MTEQTPVNKEEISIEIPLNEDQQTNQNGDQKIDKDASREATTSEKQLKFNKLNWWKRQVAALILGQILSFCISATGVTSESLATFYQVAIPTTQSFLNYFLLAIIYTTIALLKDRKSFIRAVKTRGYVLFLLALADVEANYLVVKAYEYTTITSVMLLDCFSIPCVMILSFLILKEKFKILQVFSVLICVFGLIILIFSDVLDQESSPDGSQQILGDILVLGASVLYAISNTGQQYQVERHSYIEFVALLGIFGSCISIIQVCIFELEALQEISWNYEIVLLIIGFGLSLFALYSLTPIMLILSSATLLNLSLLTSDAISLIAGIVIFNYVPSFLYFLSLIVTVGGLIVYNLVPSHKTAAPQVAKEKE